jgi:hypothetical protein
MLRCVLNRSIGWPLLSLLVTVGCDNSEMPQDGPLARTQAEEVQEIALTAQDGTSPTKQTKPFLEIDGCEELLLEPNDPRRESKVLIWRLRGSGIKNISARLIGFRDLLPATEIDGYVRCEMREPDPSDGPFEAEVVYSILRGDPFRAMGSRVGAVQLKVKTAGLASTINGNRTCKFQLPDIPYVSGHRMLNGIVERSGTVFFSDYHFPNDGKFGSGTIDTLREMSRNGGLSWGIVVAWEGTDGKRGNKASGVTLRETE